MFRMGILVCLVALTVHAAILQTPQRAPGARKPAPAAKTQPPATEAKPPVGPAKPQAAAEAKAPADVTKAVVLTATLKRGTYSDSQVRAPAWLVRISVQNPTATEVELGESLVVLEKARGKEDFVASYVARERADPPLHLAEFEPRYGLDWGYKVDKRGGALLAFMGGGRFTVTFSSKDVYPGLGYGHVGPRAKREFTVEVPMPFKLKDGPRDYIVVVPPSVRAANRAPGPILRTVVKFSGEEPKEDVEIQPLETAAFPAGAEGLRALATDAAAELWRRVFSLSYLAESFRDKSEDLLIETASGKGNAQLLRISSLSNLGLLRSTKAVGPLLEMLQSAEDSKLHRTVVIALGDIGDPAAAQALRPHLTASDNPLAGVTITALGKIKDADSVALMLAVLRDEKKRNLHREAGNALAGIRNPAAVEGLLALLRAGNNDTRRLAADKLGDARATEAVAPLISVANDKTSQVYLRKDAFAALGKIGGQDALAALRAANDAPEKEIREASLSALAKMREAGAVDAVIRLSERGDYPSREEALAALTEGERTEALPAIRRILADKGAPSAVRQAACTAVKRMKDAGAASALSTALDDSDQPLYSAALEAFQALGGKEAEQAGIGGLRSKHPEVRFRAAIVLGELRAVSATAALWQAYQAETKTWPGARIAASLLELKFSDRSAIPPLLNRMDPQKNELWFEDVRLLQHLTKQSFGPKFQFVGEKERDAELAKWREWWASQRP